MMTRSLPVISTDDVLDFFQGSVIVMANISQGIPEPLADLTKRVAVEEKQFHRFLLLLAQLPEGLSQIVFALRKEGVVFGGNGRFENVKTIIDGLVLINVAQTQALASAVCLVIRDLNQPCSKRSALRVK